MLFVAQHPNDPAGLAALAAENQRLRGELAATIAERDALAAFVNVSHFTKPRTDHSTGSAGPPATSGLAARDESSHAAMQDSATSRPPGPAGTAGTQ